MAHECDYNLLEPGITSKTREKTPNKMRPSGPALPPPRKSCSAEAKFCTVFVRAWAWMWKAYSGCTIVPI